jgi:nucleoporin POM152
MHTYRILGVTDAIYGSPDQGILALSNGKPGQLTIKQDVHARPTARFETATQRTTFCVRDELRPSRGAPTAELQLTGKAPYEVLLELGEPSRHQPIPHRIRDIATKAWALQLDHVFEHAGPHEVVVRSIVDANGCERAYEAAAAPRMTIDVAEIATIAAVAPQNDYCVGQSLDFTLQGTQPWSVTYSWTTRTDKGRSHDVEKTVTTRDPLFSRLARAPGVFRVLSVAHERDQCRSTVDDIVKTVHALPTARVGKGRRSVESIHEGEQAEIVFEFEGAWLVFCSLRHDDRFTGTPPFSFTWQRSAPQDRARRPVVLEEQTVKCVASPITFTRESQLIPHSDIRSHSYSLLTSVEGTWSVVFVQDAYCAFPPVQQLGDPQKRITQ